MGGSLITGEHRQWYEHLGSAWNPPDWIKRLVYGILCKCLGSFYNHGALFGSRTRRFSTEMAAHLMVVVVFRPAEVYGVFPGRITCLEKLTVTSYQMSGLGGCWLLMLHYRVCIFFFFSFPGHVNTNTLRENHTLMRTQSMSWILLQTLGRINTTRWCTCIVLELVPCIILYLLPKVAWENNTFTHAHTTIKSLWKASYFCQCSKFHKLGLV